MFGLTADNSETYESMSENNNEEIDDYIIDFGYNPNEHRKGRLTENVPMYYYYYFSISETSRFLLARLTSESQYIARLLKIDYESGNIYLTNLSSSSGSLIQFNGLPEGDYLFLVFTEDNSYGQNFSFDINASNPASNITKVRWINLDFSIFIFETLSGDVYGNGNLIYNTSSGIGNSLDWERVEERSWGSGYQQRTHRLFDVHVKNLSDPVSYSSRYATSDCAIFVLCDVGTGFTYYYSYYQSGPDHYYLREFEDAFGKQTPRSLDSSDFEVWNNHVLVYDLNIGKVIDFYSPLNIYYGASIEPTPIYEFLPQ